MMDNLQPPKLVYLPVQLWQTVRDLWTEGDYAYDLQDTLTSSFVLRCLQVALETNDPRDALSKARQVEKDLVLDGRMDYTAIPQIRVAMIRAILAGPPPEERPPVFAVHLFEKVSEALAWDAVAPQVGNITSVPAVPHASLLTKEVAAIAAELVRANPPPTLVYREGTPTLGIDEDLWRGYVRLTIQRLKELV